MNLRLQENDRRAALRNMMREAKTINEMKSVIACAETLGEAYSLGKIADSEELDMHIDALAASLK